MPNLDQVTALLRALLAVIGTVLTTNGTVSSSLWQQITGVIILAIPVIWSMFVHSDTGKLNAVAAMPEVAKIVVEPAHADTAAATAAADETKPKVVTQ
jgi:hypothetical protein